MKQSLHIALALAGYYPQHQAGTEAYVRNLARYLHARGKRVSIIIPDPSGDLQQYDYEGIPVYPFRVPQYASAREMNGLAPPSGLEAFRALLQELRPDILHLHSFNRALDNRHLEAAAELGIKTVFTGHLGGTFCIKGNLLLKEDTNCDGRVLKHRCTACYLHSKGLQPPLDEAAAVFLSDMGIAKLLAPYKPALNLINFKAREMETLKQVNRVVALAPWMLEAYRRNGLSNAILVRQGINTQIFRPRKESRQLPHYPLSILFVGRMHPDKGFHVLLDAIQALHREDRKQIGLEVATLPFPGERGYYNEMYERFVHLGYRQWHIQVPPDEVRQLMQGNDLLVLPSKHEAAPFVILEAFSQKMPVLGSNHIAIKDMVEDGHTGRLFANGQPQDLSARLFEILKKPTLLPEWSANIPKVRDSSETGRDMEYIYEAVLAGE